MFLVSGGSGLIGSAVVSRLMEIDQVRVIDLKRPSVAVTEFVQGDVTDHAIMRSAVRDCETVFHFASTLSVIQTEKKPVDTLNQIIDGTRSVLEACRQSDVKKFIFSSTSETYGEPDTVPIAETHSLKPKSCYGIAKVVSEEYIKSYHKEHGLPFVIYRYFNVYGPLQSNHFVIPKFVDLILRDQPVPIYGNGDQVRAYCYVDDVANGTMTTFKQQNEIFNIGNPSEPVSVKDLARTAFSALDKKERIELIPFDQSDRSEQREIFRRIPDISKAKRLGYEPHVRLAEGIRRVAEYKKRHLVPSAQ
ncbi:NAD-dependent epimerase/dehydratase family protein [Candidatus Micrarchaeota archaeon]|nr:NAD-dependent epimerase/dehydratase family protein [Candidatus Micrarchaeota archaeon]